MLSFGLLVRLLAYFLIIKDMSSFRSNTLLIKKSIMLLYNRFVDSIFRWGKDEGRYCELVGLAAVNY